MTGKNSIKKDTVLVYVGFVLRFLSQIVLIPYFGRVLGPTSYGQVLASISFMMIINVIVSYGFSMSGARDIAIAETRDKRSAILSRQIFARCLLVPIAIIIAIIGTIASPSLSQNILFGVLATVMGLSNAFGFAWFFQGLRQFRTSILLEAIAYPINIGLILFFVKGEADGLNAMMALTASSLICLAVSYFYTKKHADIVAQTLSSCISEIKKATVFFGTSFSFTILTSGSTYILSLMSTPTEVGYFGAAEKFVTFGINCLGPIGQVLMPTISKLHHEKDGAAFAVARKGIAVEMGYGLLAPILGTLLAPILIPLMLGNGFEPSIYLFQVMLWIYPFAAFKHAIILYILVPLREEKYYLMTSLLNVGIALGLAFFVVHMSGAAGMAYSRLAGEIIAAAFLLTLLLKKRLLQQFSGNAHLLNGKNE